MIYEEQQFRESLKNDSPKKFKKGDIVYTPNGEVAKIAKVDRHVHPYILEGGGRFSEKQLEFKCLKILDI
jgi:preprotein translocase subunit YajC